MFDPYKISRAGTCVPVVMVLSWLLDVKKARKEELLGSGILVDDCVGDIVIFGGSVGSDGVLATSAVVVDAGAAVWMSLVGGTECLGGLLCTLSCHGKFLE